MVIHSSHMCVLGAEVHFKVHVSEHQNLFAGLEHVKRFTLWSSEQ